MPAQPGWHGRSRSRAACGTRAAGSTARAGWAPHRAAPGCLRAGSHRARRAARRMCQSEVTRRIERTSFSAIHTAVSRALPRVSSAAKPSVTQHSISRAETSYSAANSRGLTSASTPVTSIRSDVPWRSSASPRGIRPPLPVGTTIASVFSAPAGCGSAIANHRNPNTQATTTRANDAADHSIRLSAASTVSRAVSIARTTAGDRDRREQTPIDRAERAARDHARAEPGELAPEQHHRRQPERQADEPAEHRVEPDRALEDPRDLGVGAAEQMDDLDRLAVGAERAARRQPHRRRAGRREQHDQPRRKPLQRGDRVEHRLEPARLRIEPRRRRRSGQRGAQLLEPPRGDRAGQPHVDQRRAPGSRPPRPRPAGRATARAARRARPRARGARRPRPRGCRAAAPPLRPAARVRRARLRRSARSARRRSPPRALSDSLRSARPGAGGDHRQRDHDRDDPRHRPGEPRVRHQPVAGAEARRVAADRPALA